MNLDRLITNLETYIDRNELVKADVAKKIGVSPSGLSHLLSRKVNPTGQQTLAIFNLTKGKNMTTQPQDDYALQNASVLAKYASKGMQIQHFQSSLTDGSGFVPGQSGDDLVDKGSIVDLLYNISKNDDSTVAAKLRDLVQALRRVPSETVEKATPNRNGVTREPLVIKSSGARAEVVDGQAFSSNPTGGNVLRLDKGNLTLENAKRDVARAQQEKIKRSHQSREHGINFTGDTMSESTVNFDKVAKLHENTVLADPQMKAATMRYRAVLKEREARLARGKGSIEDLSAMRNQVMYCHSGIPGIHDIDQSVLKHEDAYFNLMLETEKLNS